MEAYAAGGNRIRRLDLDTGEILCEALIDGCSAVCACAETVYAAGKKEGVIYRLDKRLLPCGVCAGGPGLSALAVSRDEKRLFALLSDADGVLMLSGHDGAPMIFARTGVTPVGMRLDAQGELLLVAGGRDGCAQLLCAKTLNTLCSFKGEGICCDALCCGNRICALLLTPSLQTLLMVWERSGSYRQICFPGAPGSLVFRDQLLFVSAGEWLYAFDTRRLRLVDRRFLENGPGKLIDAGKLLLLCRMKEMLYRVDDRRETCLCDQVHDVSVIQD